VIQGTLAKGGPLRCMSVLATELESKLSATPRTAADDATVAMKPDRQVLDPVFEQQQESRIPPGRRRSPSYALTTTVSGSISRYSSPSGGLLETVMIRVPGG
jgi:hypothetical protein